MLARGGTWSALLRLPLLTLASVVAMARVPQSSCFALHGMIVPSFDRCSIFLVDRNSHTVCPLRSKCLSGSWMENLRDEVRQSFTCIHWVVLCLFWLLLALVPLDSFILSLWCLCFCGSCSALHFTFRHASSTLSSGVKLPQQLRIQASTLPPISRPKAA